MHFLQLASFPSTAVTRRRAGRHVGILGAICQHKTNLCIAIQVNYLSTALLGLLILPALKSSTSNPNPPVMTFVTSFGVYPASPTMSAPWKGSYLGQVNKSWYGMQEQQYGKSKILLLYFARELAARASAAQTKGKGVRAVTINSADPGPAWTPLTQPNEKKFIPRLIQNYGSRDVSRPCRLLSLAKRY